MFASSNNFQFFAQLVSTTNQAETVPFKPKSGLFLLIAIHQPLTIKPARPKQAFEASIV